MNRKKSVVSGRYVRNVQKIPKYSKHFTDKETSNSIIVIIGEKRKEVDDNMTTREFIDILARDKKINCDGYDLHVYLENEDYIAITCWYGHEMVPILVFADTFSGRAYSALDINVFRGVTDIQDMPSLGEYRTRIWNEVKTLVKEQTGVECTDEMRYKSSLEFKKFKYLKRPKKVVGELAEEVIEMFDLNRMISVA